MVSVVLSAVGGRFVECWSEHVGCSVQFTTNAELYVLMELLEPDIQTAVTGSLHISTNRQIKDEDFIRCILTGHPSFSIRQ